MISMYIGSGETNLLLSGKNTQGYKKLLQRFVSDQIPEYNAKASPIDALRTGAILEDRYIHYLPESFYMQCKEVCKELDVLKSTIDFAEYEMDKIVDFHELKTCNFDDFINIQDAGLNYIKKNYKNNYNQVQYQLLCTGLEKAKLVFLVVYEYNDEINENREIKADDLITFEISRDEDVINKIKERAKFFQMIKDSYNS